MIEFLDTVCYPGKDEEMTKLTLAVLKDNLLTASCVCQSPWGFMLHRFLCISGPRADDGPDTGGHALCCAGASKCQRFGCCIFVCFASCYCILCC